jgi:hypothetical protein
MVLTEEEQKKKKEVIERIGAIGLFLPIMTTPPYELAYGVEGTKKRFDRVVERLEKLVDSYVLLRKKELEAV